LQNHFQENGTWFISISTERPDTIVAADISIYKRPQSFEAHCVRGKSLPSIKGAREILWGVARNVVIESYEQLIAEKVTLIPETAPVRIFVTV
jgi:hypothetical protein